MSKLTERIFFGIIGTSLAANIAALPFKMYSDNKWYKEQKEILESENPVDKRHVKFYTEYDFDDDNDGEVDRIERVGFYATGLRGGFPLRYRLTINHDK